MARRRFSDFVSWACVTFAFENPKKKRAKVEGNRPTGSERVPNPLVVVVVAVAVAVAVIEQWANRHRLNWRGRVVPKTLIDYRPANRKHGNHVLLLLGLSLCASPPIRWERVSCNLICLDTHTHTRTHTHSHTGRILFRFSFVFLFFFSFGPRMEIEWPAADCAVGRRPIKRERCDSISGAGMQMSMQMCRRRHRPAPVTRNKQTRPTHRWRPKRRPTPTEAEAAPSSSSVDTRAQKTMETQSFFSFWSSSSSSSTRSRNAFHAATGAAEQSGRGVHATQVRQRLRGHGPRRRLLGPSYPTTHSSHPPTHSLLLLFLLSFSFPFASPFAAAALHLATFGFSWSTRAVSPFPTLLLLLFLSLPFFALPLAAFVYLLNAPATWIVV